MKKTLLLILVPILCLSALLSGCSVLPAADADVSVTSSPSSALVSPESTSKTPTSYETLVPEYSGGAFDVLNGNEPEFSADQLVTTAYEYYSELDYLGRCGVAISCIGREIMPTEERGSIGQVKPTGWHTVKYDIVDGKYLYNRCHLIGFQLTGENANVCNLITGTRYMNTEGMLPFENMVADYVKETGNHVLYRVTPVFEGTELVARGVKMEAFSVEDNGDGICFNVFVHNVQPGIEIDYATGDSRLATNGETTETESGTADYILNTSSKKFHLPSCSSVSDILEKNRGEYSGSREDLIAMGYSPCGNCKP
ncbi:MAG: DNA/RNA non-specific endonuclease [Eubacteriales bacterium]